MTSVPEQYTFTLIPHGSKATESQVAEVKSFIASQAEAELLSVNELSSGRVFDFQVRFKTDFNDSSFSLVAANVKSHLLDAPKDYDLVFQKSDTRKDKKLFVFDMDSTLIYQEVIELIAAYADIEDKVAEITERAMNGELDFNELLRERVALLKGIDATTIWDELKHKIKITKGARELTKALKKLGVTMAVCSGGFIPLALYVKDQLLLDYAYANQLSTDSENRLDGTTIGVIVNGDKKAELLTEIAANHGIDPTTAVAVGDGANDLKMMATAGFGVAWHAKPTVQKQAPCCLNSDSLQDILYIMGFNDKEIEQLLE